jgi:uncharacterized protein YjbI with pentapeptide repeats
MGAHARVFHPVSPADGLIFRSLCIACVQRLETCLRIRSVADTAKKGWQIRGKAADDAFVATERRRWRWPRRTIFLVFLLGVLAGLILWQVPQLQITAARERLAAEDQLSPTERLTLENDLFQAETAARSTLALILAAGGLLLGLSIAWRRYEISRELQTHERFAKAVEQLGSERSDGSARTEARLGGIYALERLLAESEREYWPIMEVLTAYVRENAAWKPDARSASASGPFILPADVQAILAVLGRRKPHANSTERRLLDLRETDLRGANLSGSRLDGVTLHGAHLEKIDATRSILSRSNLREANLSGASLTEADLEGASLSRANLEGARLNGANLKGADLSGANLRGADLWEANLKGCNLKDADLREADLSQTMLEGAILWRADLQDAVLSGTHLKETHLERANLAGATGLTWEQGEDAYTDENTILPDYLRPAEMGNTLPPIVHDVVPTPAARRMPARIVQRPAPPPPEPRDNVVDLTSARRNASPAARQPKAQKREAPPKKAAMPKHRKPGLVKPA